MTNDEIAKAEGFKGLQAELRTAWDTSLAPFKVGQRVRVKRLVERFPYFNVLVGATGTINEMKREHEWGGGNVSVKLDLPITGAEEWDNCCHWTDDYLLDFHDDVEHLQSTAALPWKLIPVKDNPAWSHITDTNDFIVVEEVQLAIGKLIVDCVNRYHAKLEGEKWADTWEGNK